MGTIRQRNGRYYAEVCIDRVRRGKTHRTKAAAAAWIKEQERAGAIAPAHTLRDALNRYRQTYSAHKPSHAREAKRLERLGEQLGAATPLIDLNPDRLAHWRDAALARVSAASVLRDWALLNHLLRVATIEWQWIPSNPLEQVTRPRKPEPRARIWREAEIAALVYCTGWPATTALARTGGAFLFALETAMRAGEICRIRPDHVHRHHVHVPHTKNGHPRDVPLSAAARAILKAVNKDFRLTETQLDALFRKARARALLNDLRFHDTRRTALTRLATRFSALELARISGHRDLRILLSTYYAPDVEDLAARLD